MKNKKERAVKAAVNIRKWNHKLSSDEQTEIEQAVRKLCDVEVCTDLDSLA